MSNLARAIFSTLQDRIAIISRESLNLGNPRARFLSIVQLEKINFVYIPDGKYINDATYKEQVTASNSLGVRLLKRTIDFSRSSCCCVSWEIRFREGSYHVLEYNSRVQFQFFGRQERSFPTTRASDTRRVKTHTHMWYTLARARARAMIIFVYYASRALNSSLARDKLRHPSHIVISSRILLAASWRPRLLFTYCFKYLSFGEVICINTFVPQERRTYRDIWNCQRAK